MDPKLQSNLNRALQGGLNALGHSCASNFTALEKSFGSQPLTWMKQLGTDLAAAQQDYDNLLTASVEKEIAPDMAKVTKALERMLTAAFCLQVVTRAASPKIAVVSH